MDEESWPLRDAISVIAARVSLEYEALISPRVIGRERWERMARERFSFYENVAREGIPLVLEPVGALFRTPGAPDPARMHLSDLR